MFSSMRIKLIVGFLSVSLLAGSVSLFVGNGLLYRVVLNEAKDRIRLDLNAAREIYQSRVRGVETALHITTLGPGFRSALRMRDARQLAIRMARVAQVADLDFAGIVTREGRTLCRIGPRQVPDPGPEVENPLAGHVLRRGAPVSGTVLLSGAFLAAESPKLAERARIPLLPTPKAAPRPEGEETFGLSLAAATPVFEGDELLGVVYGGVLLNRSEQIVDTVRETVFQQETYRGQKIGTATVFLNDTRISTNVLTPDGRRAIGTRASQEVRNRVLLEGQKWTDRAYVVSDWYITGYEPIVDILGRRVGMLYVGVLEAKYVEMGRKAFSILILITAGALVLSVGLGCVLEARITRPVQWLVRASAEVSRGNLSPEIGPVSRDEIGVLQNTFREMLSSLRERDRRQQVESENKLLQSERQASVGRLAAGVAHEINNPLTGVLTFTHMLLRRTDLSDEVRADLESIGQQTERVRKIVRSLLDFSRQTKLDLTPTDVNELLKSALSLANYQALIKGIRLSFEPGEGLPERNLDRSQFQSVLFNLLINAMDATQPGGAITVSTRLSVSPNRAEGKGIEVAVADTGCGIPPENLGRLFDPFYTTKEVGQGTGLGLSVSLGIIERHGGTIRVRSEVGKGSTFTIRLPVEEGREGLENPGGG